MKMKILATDGLSGIGVQLLENAGHEVIKKKVAQNQLSNYITTNEFDGVLVKRSTPLTKAILSESPTLKFIGNCDIISTHIDVEFAEQKGLSVFQAITASSTSIAELTIGHLLSCVRHLKDSNREMPLEGDSKFENLRHSYSAGTEVEGKTLGIIGFGNVGQEVAKKAIGLGMKVLYYDKNEEHVEITLDFYDQQTVKFNLSSSPLKEVLSTSDFVSLHVTTKQKNYFIGAKELKEMKPTAGLINTSYFKAIDEVALVKSLESNELRFAALDVFEDEPQPPIQLLMNPKLSLSPNIGGATQETQDRIAIELANQILSYLN
jgi:D-3-phosphoglycerate dehydrogenase